MKIATWNVNSIRARRERLLAFLERHNPDVVCLQETKVTDEDFPKLELAGLGYHSAHLGQRAYNGVAILSKQPPLEVRYGVGVAELDEQSRVIAARFDFGTVISAYFPNGQDAESDKYVFKLNWLRALHAYMEQLVRSEANIYLCGDFNIAPHEDDVGLRELEGSVLANAEVRAAFEGLCQLGLVDVVRRFFPFGGIYTWWDYRAMGFERNHGLRIDHVLCSQASAAHVIGAAVDRMERSDKGASDHAPLLIQVQDAGTCSSGLSPQPAKVAP